MSIKKDIGEVLDVVMEKSGDDIISLRELELTFLNGTTVSFHLHDKVTWEDNGKSQFRSEAYQVYVSKNEEELGEPINMFFLQDVTRSGSYYSDYEYYYEKPYQVTPIKRQETITVKEWTPITK